jgi:large subunit ribosomal protein L24
MARHVRKGDTVVITAGAHRGKVGEIMRVITDKDQVVIKGINMRTKHLKPTRISPQGGIITKEAPIHISNVSPAVDGKPTRVRFQVRDDGSKVRVAVRGGKVLGEVRGGRAKAKK